ncbi:MAG: hypothetical protein ABSG49_02695 [Methanoregula sp.]|jgi:hypothetical protein|uniref:hypothetical protein n=1 Tax=Methanoregula sp. TaxID=2052170 RepID=UPI003C207938
MTTENKSVTAPAANDNTVEKEIENQKAEWIKYAQTSQRNLSDKYNETAKTLVTLFSAIFGAFTLLLSFFGLPGQVNVNMWIAMATIICFAVSIIFMVIVIGPREFLTSPEGLNYSNSDAIWQTVSDRNSKDHRNLSIGIVLFIIGIILIPCSIAISVINPGQNVQVLTTNDKVPYLENLSVSFLGNSSLTEEMLLIRQDTKTYSFKLPNGEVIKLNSDWVQAIVTKQ